MKIGILTFQYVDNYGAVLQAYALREYLIEKGYNVEIINYDNSVNRDKYRSPISKSKTLIWSFLKLVAFGNKKKKAFESFRTEYLGIKEDKIREKEQLNIELNRYDVVIVGSDQVWNPAITGYDTAYLLDFDNVHNKISYAASIGKSQIEDEWLEEIIDKVRDFKAVSVREKTAKDIIVAQNCHKNVIVVLDPVFLLEDKDWVRISEASVVPERFILCYIMPGDVDIVTSIENSAKSMSKKYNLPIVYLGRKEYKKFTSDGYELISASPREFVGLFSKAEMVLTNSFHGTAFSLIFQKNFYSFVNGNLSLSLQLGSRIQDLLYSCELSSRCVSEEITEMQSVDYTQPKKSLAVLIQNSREFLNGILKTD